MNRFLYWLFLLPGASVLAQSSGKNPAPLTVETIMQDPKIWVGTSPSNPFWSDDSRTLYFNWNPVHAKGESTPGGPTLGDSLYKVTLTRAPRSKTLVASQPVKVNPAERRMLPTAPVAAYNRAYTQRLFDRQGDLFLVDVKSGAIWQLTNTVETEADPTFSGDEQRVIFRRSGNLFSIHLKSGELTQLTDFRTGAKKADRDGGPAKLTDEEKFLKQDQLRLSSVLSERKAKKDEADRISKADRPKRPKEIYIDDKTVVNPQVSPDGRFITYRLLKSATGAKTAQVPNYVTESGYTEDISARTKVGAPTATQEFFVYDIVRDTVRAVPVKDIPGIYDKPAYLQSPGKAKADTAKKMRAVVVNGPVWSEDGKQCVVVVRAQDNKDRWIMRLDEATLRLSLLDRQHDDAWIGGPGIGSLNTPGNLNFLADNQTLWFQSEADGYSHIYTVNVLTSEKQQLTSGKFEVQQVQVSKDKTHFFLQTNEVHPGEQHFYQMPIVGGTRTRLTTMTGANDVTLSPNETLMAIRYSSSTQPWELYASVVSQESLVDSKKSSPRTVSSQNTNTPAPLQLTHSQTEAFKAYSWREPTLVTIPARDGQTIYARLYKSEKPNGKSVVFVHGAGYLQNAHKWWSQYFREYMFHNLLADKGYTVLDIDYRGSAGYGRDWRTGIYRHMGGKDLDDHADAAKWLVQTQGVDAKRIGIYGGSYGGFITLMAMFTTTDRSGVPVFKAGAALRPVTDWAAYNHPYTANILNEPQMDSLAYRRSSPINFAEGLKGHLLICHRMVDVNVHFQDAVRLAQRLIELKKENWELAAYPVEDHGFVEPTSWMDEYKRILKLFEERL